MKKEKRLVELDENSPNEELFAAMKSAREYGPKNAFNSKVKRAARRKAILCVSVGYTPEGIHAMFLHNFMKNQVATRAFLVLKGSEGGSYAGEWTNNNMYVLHSHAISRYIERSQTAMKRDLVTLDIIDKLSVTSVQNDSDTFYVSYRDGIFLCTYKGGVLHIRTYITNSQCHRNQRLWSSKAKMETEKFMKEIGIR